MKRGYLNKMAVISKQRTFALLLILGASILLWRTIQLLFFEQGLEILTFWVIWMTIAESVIDISCIVGSVRWLISNDRLKATIPLRLGGFAAIFHAVRVLIYVLGRTGPWVNFDVNPAYHSTYSFEWFWVWFAATLSILGIVGVIIIWQVRSRLK